MLEVSDPRPSAPYEEPETIFVDEVLVSSAHGIHIPQIFTEQNKQLGSVPDWAWNTCNAGPDSTDDHCYWDAWSAILDAYEFRRSGPCGCTERCFLDYKQGDLVLMYEIIEPADDF